MARKKHSRGLSDSTLSMLWAQAVKAKYKRCPITGQKEGLQAHHIIYRGRQNRYFLRWDIRNGAPLSVEAHKAVHEGDPAAQKKLSDYVITRGDLEYLQERKNWLKKDGLMRLGMTDDEYRQRLKEELERVIDDY